MPRNKISNDLDHVRQDLKPLKTPKGYPPKPWPLPKYKPVRITKLFGHGHGQLPNIIAFNDPYAIFILFFSYETLQTLVQHTNEYAFLFPGPETSYSRFWFPTTVKELRAYLGVLIWMGLHVELTVLEFWNQDPLKGAIYAQVFKHISLRRWQQIDRYFYILKPILLSQQESPFAKLEPLSETLRLVFKKY